MSEVSLRSLSVQVAAEADDVMVLVRDAVFTLKDGGNVASLIPDLVKAVDGVAGVVEALRTKPLAVVRSVVLRGLEIAENLLGQDVQPL
jgi:hypothetical protein